MKYVATQYSLKDRALDIFFAGCLPPHCPGCHNPELQQFTSEGREMNYILLKLRDEGNMIDHLRLMGGEPLDQDIFELREFIFRVKDRFPWCEIWIFTKYLPEELTDNQREVLNHVQYVKHGRYLQDNPGYTCGFSGIELGSGNQFVLAYPRHEVDSNDL